ncbi:MAG TPA: hypothetical protein PLK84_08725, partial [Syntrophales bacterium]|nr:hypothetical protein [Syntrophales bacterium]
MSKIRSELGPDAVVLSTRKLRGGRSPLLEVTAAVDAGPVAGAGKARPGKAQAAPPPPREEGEAAAGDLRRDLGEIKTLLAESALRSFPYGEFLEMREMLDTFFD